VAIAVHCGDADLLRSSANVAEIRLQAGDLLLIPGPEPRIEAMRGQWDLMMLDSKLIMPRTPLAPWALSIMAALRDF
jgi:hypothetical protein